MRSVAQSLLARHPVFAGVGVGCRWVLWLAAGHPFGLIVIGLAVIAGLPWWYRALVWVGTEVALGLWGFAGLTTGAQSLYLWGHLCRFRRRWPGEFARAYRSDRWPPVVVDNHYSVPGGLRPMLAAPRLSIMPRALDHQTIGWRMLPLADHDLVELAAAVGRVGGADDRIGSIDLRVIPGGQLALIVGFRFVGTGRSSRLPTGLELLEQGGLPEVDLDLADPLRSVLDIQGADADLVLDTGSNVATLGGFDGQAIDIGGDDDASVPGSGDSTPDDRSAAVMPGPLDGGRQPIGGGGGSGSSLPPNTRTSEKRRQGFPMKWSFSVILPSNALVAFAVAASDAGRIGILAVCAATAVSIVLIVAEGVASR